jgi:hypothetical protein
LTSVPSGVLGARRWLPFMLVGSSGSVFLLKSGSVFLLGTTLVPIPNRRGRHPAAPFGLGPWDGARVASQQSPVLRPGQRYCSHQKKAVLSQRRHEEARIGPVVRSELPWGNLRSLPWGPTRVGTWMRRFPPARGEGKPHDALDGVPLTGRNSHQIIPRLPDRRPGRAAHGSS